MIIKIQLNTGHIINVDIDIKDTVVQIKEKIFKQEGLHPAQQKLIHSGQLLQGSKTAEELQLRAGTTLQLVVNLRGG
ncbi:Ubiquitin [Spironucleus salmonicida]|uniref:Ubiquitin n=1 Tax=Spironucleus salmonicida TaxID=348837 RepID=V6LAD8_9EUKA|nr:Ubiquitin [Spironucleus salmonicida]|eukprot:EST41415.1 Ubiquitin [Spironucleus salmonicida]